MDLDQEDDALVLASEGETAALTPARERMIIRHLPYFVTLAEMGNFRCAGERLGLSQSALTRRIQTLEDELDIQLFTRTHRSATLTAAGQTLFEDSGRILQDLRAATRRAQLAARGEAGDIHIGLNEPSLRSPVVVVAFRNLSVAFPELNLHLHAMPSEAQKIALPRGDIDLGFQFNIGSDKTSPRELDYLRIGYSRSVLAMNEAHPLARLAKIRLADLAGVGLTWPSRRAGRSIGDAMFAAFHAAGVSPNIALEVMSEETTMNLAAANLCVGFVLEPACTPPGVVLRQVDDYRAGLTLHAAWRREGAHAGVHKIVDALRQQVGLHGPADDAPVSVAKSFQPVVGNALLEHAVE